MHNVLKNGWHSVVIFTFVLVFVTSTGIAFATDAPVVATTCPELGVSITSRSGSNISFGWAPVEGVGSYQISYYCKETNQSSGVVTTGSCSITFTNLPPGTYTFYFNPVCGGGASEYYIIDDILIP